MRIDHRTGREPLPKKVTVLLARPDLYREMNEAYAEFFPEAKPARAMVRFGADIPDVLVAIEAVALV